VNVPPTIGMVVSTGKATMAELSTVLSVEDLWDLMEIILVDNHNRELFAAETRKGQR
jgi:hypothetical protein